MVEKTKQRRRLIANGYCGFCQMPHEFIEPQHGPGSQLIGNFFSSSSTSSSTCLAACGFSCCPLAICIQQLADRGRGRQAGRQTVGQSGNST